ncbi:uncharacterized protein V1518DRAFT_419144 [Limtongia smithiae]|uniref:uncharacterized protein n=1 Tax=Limtongia smithiae TaxID=1125753 RepID=UPI0034CFC527
MRILLRPLANAARRLFSIGRIPPTSPPPASVSTSSKRAPRRPRASPILPEPEIPPPPGSARHIDPDRLAKIPYDWRKQKKLPAWQKRQYEVKERLGGATWDPRKKLSPEARQALRVLREQYPEVKASELAKFFGISHEAVRRILRSHWQPLTTEENNSYLLRWERRKDRILDEWERIGRIGKRESR